MHEALKVPRILWMGLLSGMVVFSGISWMLGQQASMSGTVTNVLLIVLGSMGVSCAMVYFILRASLVSRMRTAWRENPSDGDPVTDLAPQWLTIWILGAALIEGVGLFGFVVHLISGNQIAFGLGLGAIVLLLLRFPTEASLRAYASSITT